jgi:hypothetical protein
VRTLSDVPKFQERERPAPTFSLSYQIFGYGALAAATLLIILRMYVPHPSRPSPRSKVLMELVSIAIWNRNKIVIGIVVAVWGTSISFFLESESLLQTTGKLIHVVRYRYLTGELSISITFGSSGLMTS